MSQYQYSNQIKPTTHSAHADPSINSRGYTGDSSCRTLNTATENLSVNGSILFPSGVISNQTANTPTIPSVPMLGVPVSSITPSQPGLNTKHSTIGLLTGDNPNLASFPSASGSSMTSLQPTYPALPFIYRNNGNALDPKPTPSANVSSSEITLSIPDQLQQQLQTYGYPQSGPYSIQQKYQHIKQPPYQDHQTRQQSPTQQIMSTIPPQIPDNVLRKPNIPGTEQPDVDWNNPENYNSQPNTDSKRPGGLVLPNRHYSLPQSNVGTAYINSGQVPGSTLSSTSYPSSARGYPVGSASTGLGYDINKPSYYYDSNSVHQPQALTQQQYYSYHATPADSDSYLVPQPIVNGLPQHQQQVVQEQNTTQHNVNQSPKTFQGYNDYKYNIYQGSNGGNAYGAYYPDMPDRTRVASSLLYNLTGEANSAHYAQPAEYEAAPPNNSVMFNTHYAISMQYPNQEYLHHLPHQKEPQSPKRFRPRKSIEGKQMPMSRASNSVSLLVQEWFVIEPTIEQREKMFSNKWRLGTTETSYFNKRKRAIGVIHNVEKQFPNLNKFQIAKYIDDYLKVKKFKYPQFISHIQTVVQRQQCEREILEYIRNELEKA